MSTLPTPRTDAMCECYCGPLCWIGDQQFIPASFAQELERELTAAVAERDAARETVKRLNYRCQQAESIVAKSGLVEGREQGPTNRSLGRALANYAAQQNQLKADRWRALAEELAGALEECRSYLCTYRPDAIITIDQANAALARFRDAANPASGRTTKEEAP